MARKKLEPKGNPQEKDTFSEVSHHYTMSRADLSRRIKDFDKRDILFRSFIEEGKWPYRSMVFDPRVFTVIFEKTARMFANKPRGRMVPREGGDAIKAKINNELLGWQWDDNERVDSNPLLAKWAMMDMNARKYGASFGLTTWHWEKHIKDEGETKKSVPFFDGPNFKPWDNRDVLVNPAYSTVKNWIQLRGYPTLQELQDTNDVARSKPIYKNLDLLKMAVQEEGGVMGNKRDSNYVSKNKSISGLIDYLGQDQTQAFKTIEIITEYRDNRWITFSPRYGVVIRDIPNPYKHQQIPVVLLKYYSIDDDIYGLSEIEPVEKLQRALNAYLCQNLDTLNMGTYNPLKINQTGGAVQMHTLEFGPGAKWLMNNPQTDVVPFEFQSLGVAELPVVYRLIVGAIQEALGETSAGVSNVVPGGSTKTATEIRSSDVQRNARDNFNQIFLSEAIKKQMMFWHTMNQQFLFSNKTDQQKIIRIVGKDAIKYFDTAGLGGMGLDQQGIDLLSNPDMAHVNPADVQSPLFPVQTSQGMIPKFSQSPDGQYGELYIEPDDLAGDYDYIPDIESMVLPDSNQMIAASSQFLNLVINPQTTALLGQEQYRIKMKDLLEDYYEKLGNKDADKYFEKIQSNPMMGGMQNGQPIQGGVTPGAAGGLQPSAPGMLNGGVPGMGQGSQAVPLG